MYFSRMPVNVNRRETLRMLASPYSMHAAVEAAFPQEAIRRTDEGGRILWRIDNNQGEEPCLYVVSPERPDLESLNSQIGYAGQEGQLQICEYDAFLESLCEKQIVSFRLTANPIYVSHNSAHKPGVHRVLPHATSFHQLRWLIGNQIDGNGHDAESRLARIGLRACCDGQGEPQVIVSKSNRVRIHKPNHERPLTVVQFDGLAEVEDVDALRHTLIGGIGQAKGFGCGMLTVIPQR